MAERGVCSFPLFNRLQRRQYGIPDGEDFGFAAARPFRTVRTEFIMMRGSPPSRSHISMYLLPCHLISFSVPDMPLTSRLPWRMVR